METYVLPMSHEGEVTIPEKIRRRLGIDDEHSVVLIMRDDGSVELRRDVLALEDVFGSIPTRPGMSDDLDAEIKAATEEHYAEKYKHFKR